MRGTVAKKLRKIAYGDNVSSGPHRKYQIKDGHQLVAEERRRRY
jgi:hypothetical protein